MKKLGFVLLICLSLALAGCGKTEEKETETTAAAAAFEGDFTEIFEKLIEKTVELEPLEKGVDGNDYPGMLKSLLAEDGYGATNVPVDAEGCESVLGLSAEELSSLVAESLEEVPNGSWFTHSIVLVRVTEGSDTAAVAQKILEGTSPNRFGCLTPNAISVSYAGDYILLAASGTDTVDAAMNAFAELSAVTPTRLDREDDWSGGGFGGLMNVGG